ncbi:MAG: ComF family protein [Solirubrobacterales bacterium]
MRPFSPNRGGGLARNALSLVAPPRCAICAAACASADAVCARCARELRAARPGFAPLRDQTPLVWATTYERTPRALVSALKFAGRLALADLAAESIARALESSAAVNLSSARDAPASPAAVVPVPASPLRRRLRGFDPAELIATRLAARLGLPLSTSLARTHHRRQTGRSRADRLADPPRIRVRDPVPARGLLVDDVLTTGATLTACARALRAAGSDDIEAAVFARSP